MKVKYFFFQKFLPRNPKELLVKVCRHSKHDHFFLKCHSKAILLSHRRKLKTSFPVILSRYLLEASLDSCFFLSFGRWQERAVVCVYLAWVSDYGREVRQSDFPLFFFSSRVRRWLDRHMLSRFLHFCPWTETAPLIARWVQHIPKKYTTMFRKTTFVSKWGNIPSLTAELIIQLSLLIPEFLKFLNSRVNFTNFW